MDIYFVLGLYILCCLEAVCDTDLSWVLMSLGIDCSHYSIIKQYDPKKNTCVTLIESSLNDILLPEELKSDPWLV